MSARTLLASLRPTEKVTQQQIVRLFKLAGGIVRSTSQYRASHIAAGLPDLHVSFPRAGKRCWFECKRPAAKGFDFSHPETWILEPLRPEQMRFHNDCKATGQPYFHGGVRQAEQALAELGLGGFLNGRFTLTVIARTA